MTDGFAGATSGVLYPTMNITFKIETLEIFLDQFSRFVDTLDDFPVF